jgi:predicted nuclease of predicted toxin-antitoxin system
VRILADEDVEFPIIERLRIDGHAVAAIVEQAPGSPDITILERAVRENVLLLTADRDFGDYVFRDRRPAPIAGIVLYRLGNSFNLDEKATIVGDTFAQHGAGEFAAHFTVIDGAKVRFRPLP